VEQDDVRLIDLVLQGDSAAFSVLVRRYQDRLFTALVHIASSRDEAEDVAQEAFIQAYVKLSSFERQSSFYTWLYRIAFNTAISRRRRKRVETSVEQAKDAVGDEPADRGDSRSSRGNSSQPSSQSKSATERTINRSARRADGINIVGVPPLGGISEPPEGGTPTKYLDLLNA